MKPIRGRSGNIFHARLIAIFIITFLFFIECCLADESSVPTPLRLTDLIPEVLKCNPKLASARSNSEAASHVIPRVQTLSDPQLSIMSEDTPFKSGSELMPMIRYQISQMFPFPGKLALRGKIAEQGLEIARSEESTTIRDLILQTKRLYYELYLNQAARRINEQNRVLIRRFVDGALIRYKAGKGEYAEVLKAQIEFQMLENELLTLQNDRAMVASMLNALLDRPANASVGEPVEEFSPPKSFNYEALVQTAMQQCSELKGMQAMIIEKKSMAALARRDFYPDLMISAQYQQITKGGDDAWGVGVGMNLPIWINRKQKREAAEAEARAMAAESTLEGMRAMIRSQIQGALVKLQTTESRLTLYKTSLIPATIQTLDAGEARYRAGMGDFLMLLDTQRQLKALALDYERARMEREQLLADLERATCGAFPE
jgi:outer membrane protein TolC